MGAEAPQGRLRPIFNQLFSSKIIILRRITRNSLIEELSDPLRTERLFALAAPSSKSHPRITETREKDELREKR